MPVEPHFDDISPRNEAEAAFVVTLKQLPVGRLLDFWERGDLDQPLLIISLDFPLQSSSSITRTLRLDFDKDGIKGGWSPACLNWDDGVPAVEAGIDLAPPEGINVAAHDASPAELARIGAQWFEDHMARGT